MAVLENRNTAAPERGKGSTQVLDECLTAEARGENLLAVKFTAMASPCEVLLPSMPLHAALAWGKVVAHEVWRIERKFSRYRDDSVTAWIHRNRGAAIDVDPETASLMDFASQCFELSEGLFDITSGVLRRAWTFDGSGRIPDACLIEHLLPLVGFEKLQWRSPRLLLPEGMELDFGGVGKEYAVDRAYFKLAAARARTPFLINLGGDLRANRPPSHGPWQIGVERPGTEREATMLLELEQGALATSGDSRRYLLRDGIRYSHILNPLTGWPNTESPRSITVAASTCTEAGLPSTVAMLHGAGAGAYLDEQGVRYWLLQ
jgi:FAD:protein FMN transferase